jgi:predicted metalloprotease with PDZ domain
VVRLLFKRFERDGAGFPEAGGYQAAAEQVAGGSLADFFARYVAGTDELDYGSALGAAGLRLDWSYAREPEHDRPPATLGITTKTEGERLKVSHALADGPGYAAGIYAGDELLALDGYRVDEERLRARLAERRPGDSVTLSLFRRDELIHVPVTLAAARHDKLTIARVGEPSAEQAQIYEGWIGSTFAEQPQPDRTVT